MIEGKKIEEAANKHIEIEYARYNSGEVEEEMICLRGKDSFKAGAKWAINEFWRIYGIQIQKSQIRARAILLPLVLITMLIYNLKNPFFGKRNLGDIRLADAKSSSGLIYLTYCQSRKEVNNERA